MIELKKIKSGLLFVNTAVLGLLFATGCSDEESTFDFNSVNNVIIKNQGQWMSSGLIDYSFTLSRIPGDCPTADALRAVNIVIEDSVVSSVTYAQSGEPAPISRGATIDDLFVEQLTMLNKSPRQFSETKQSEALPSYDPDFHYPVSFYVDLSSAECDATQVRVSDFI